MESRRHAKEKMKPLGKCIGDLWYARELNQASRELYGAESRGIKELHGSNRMKFSFGGSERAINVLGLDSSQYKLRIVDRGVLSGDGDLQAKHQQTSLRKLGQPTWIATSSTAERFLPSLSQNSAMRPRDPLRRS